MAAKENPKLDLEFTLEKLDFPQRKHWLHTDHALEATLLWPRVGIARKNFTQMITLREGVWNGTDCPWNQRILFKESCEGRFAIQIALSVSVTRTWLRSFRRTVFGYALKSAGETVDDIGMAGEALEWPLKALSKNLLASAAPEILASGTFDLSANDFSACSEKIVEIPLFSDLRASKARKHLTGSTRQIGSAMIKICH